MHTLKKGRIQAFMSLFRDNRTLERLEDRIAKQEQLADDLERTVRGLKLEYVELYDKVRHQMSRMAKRSAVDDQRANDAEVIEPPDDGLDPISRTILAQRNAPRPTS